MMLKPLYDENDRYTNEANELFEEAQLVIEPVFRTYFAQGYSARDISHLICSAVTEMEAVVLLSSRYGTRPDALISRTDAPVPQTTE